MNHSGHLDGQRDSFETRQIKVLAGMVNINAAEMARVVEVQNDAWRNFPRLYTCFLTEINIK